MQYTRKDAAEKKDATAYIQDIMRISKGLNWAQKDGLITAFHHLTESVKQSQLRQSAWYAVCSAFGKHVHQIRLQHLTKRLTKHALRRTSSIVIRHGK